MFVLREQIRYDNVSLLSLNMSLVSGFKLTMGDKISLCILEVMQCFQRRSQLLYSKIGAIFVSFLSFFLICT